MPTDTERLDFLEQETERGACPALIFDDNGHWAISYEGIQNVPNSPDPEEIATSFWIEKSRWKNSIREAIDAQIAARKESDDAVA